MRPEDIWNSTVIIAPLDWGMGHVTRCVTIIRQLLEQKNKVVFAGVQSQINFINKDFPSINTELIRGYDVTLDSTRPTYFQMIAQFGKLKKVIKSEREIAEKLVVDYNADYIISDNRYGFRSDKTKNVILTHQLEVPIPLLGSFVNKRIRKHIEEFDYCWLPDKEMDPICEDMIKPELKIPKFFIGLLNRFEKKPEEIKYDYLIIISGPEPERTHFINYMLQAVQNSKKRFCFVSPKLISYENCVVNPSTAELNQLINRSETVISRAGYTTIMEMISLQKKSILIPTKGQFEQEYLSKIIRLKTIDFKNLDDIIF